MSESEDMTVGEIYKLAQDLINRLQHYPINVQEFILSYCLRLIAHNAIMAEMEET